MTEPTDPQAKVRRCWAFYRAADGAVLQFAVLTRPPGQLCLELGAQALEVTQEQMATASAYPYVASGQLVNAPAAPSPDHVWNWATKGWELTLERAQAAKWQEIKRARDAVEYGGFTCNGVVFDSDEVSRGRITGAVSLALIAQAAGQPFTRRWTLKDNSSVDLDAAGMIAVGVALGLHVGAAHDHANALRIAINDAVTPETVQAIAW